MELIKQNSQTKIIKSLIIIFFGSILLAISAKIKNTFLSSANDDANICSYATWNKFWR